MTELYCFTSVGDLVLISKLTTKAGEKLFWLPRLHSHTPFYALTKEDARRMEKQRVPDGRPFDSETRGGRGDIVPDEKVLLHDMGGTEDKIQSMKEEMCDKSGELKEEVHKLSEVGKDVQRKVTEVHREVVNMKTEFADQVSNLARCMQNVQEQLGQMKNLQINSESVVNSESIQAEEKLNLIMCKTEKNGFTSSGAKPRHVHEADANQSKAEETLGKAPIEGKSEATEEDHRMRKANDFGEALVKRDPGHQDIITIRPRIVRRRK